VRAIPQLWNPDTLHYAVLIRILDLRVGRAIGQSANCGANPRGMDALIVATEIPGDGFREFGLRFCDGGRRSESFGTSEAAPLIKRSSARVVVGVID
jgi:hypothetical protein